jgi:hypothetical protein
MLFHIRSWCYTILGLEEGTYFFILFFFCPCNCEGGWGGGYNSSLAGLHIIFLVTC